MNKLAMILLAVNLTSCAALNQDASWSSVHRTLSGMKSGDAIARLGIPTNERYVSGNKVLSWKDSEAGGRLYCEYTAMYDAGDRYVRSNYEGQNGPCYNWLVRRGFSN